MIPKSVVSILKLFITFVVGVMLAACSRKTMLQEGQKLLYLQAVVGNQTLESEALEGYFRQQANKKVLGFPLPLYAYNFGLSFYDSSLADQKKEQFKQRFEPKIRMAKSDKTKKRLETKYEHKLQRWHEYQTNGNWWMRILGSPPVIFDTSLANMSSAQLKAYAKSKGFFYASVQYKVDTVGNSVFVRYRLTENNRYYISNYQIICTDGFIKRIINEHIDQVLVTIGQPYDEDKIVAERERIELLLKNNGYFEFNKKYISFQVDSAQQHVDITCLVDNPSEFSQHKLYKLSGIEFQIDNEGLNESTQRKDDFQSIPFHYYTSRWYKPRVIYNKMELGLNRNFSLTDSKRTQRNLTQLDVFKFVNITYSKDTNNLTLKATISASSLNKYQITDELGFSVSQGLPGPFGSVGFTNRNIFNHCEIFNINVRAGIEGVASASDPGNIYSSQQFGLNSSLTFPRLLGFGFLNHWFNNYNPKTSINSSYNFIFRPEYTRSSLQFFYTYSLQLGRFSNFNINPVDIVYLRTPFISRDFADYLDVLLRDFGNSLKTSFRNSINPNINFAYTYNSFELGQNKNASFLRLFFESGGTSLNLLTNSVQTELWKRLEVTNSFQYVKFNIDVRKYLPVTRKSTLAGRINIGIARPYGSADERNMPYEKYYFTGGSNSIRAWLPRRLGPGSYRDTINTDRIYRYEQPGLILLEFNIEYRFKIIKFLDGAFFADGGNVWWYNDADSRKNLKRDSYTEIAVGAGAGIRFDFDFLVVRLDVATKVYDPGERKDQRFVANRFNLTNIFNDPNQTLWNIAIGYPF